MCPTQLERTHVKSPVGTDGCGGEEYLSAGMGGCGKMAPVLHNSNKENISRLSPLVSQQMKGKSKTLKVVQQEGGQHASNPVT